MTDVEKRGGKSSMDDEKSLAQVVSREAFPGSRTESLSELEIDGVDEAFKEKCYLSKD